jgi:hypothetical protein
LKYRCFLSVFLLLSAIPVAAAAQPSDADKATARTLTVEGYEALEKKDFAGALERFTRADSMFHAPTITLGIARAQVGLGKLVAAREIYNRLVHEEIPANASAGFKTAIEDGKRDLSALERRIPYVTIHVQGAPSPRITLDGADVPAAALGVRRPVDPGKHVIRATAAGLAPSEKAVTLGEGKSEVVKLELKPEAPAPPGAAPPAIAAGAPPPPAAEDQASTPQEQPGAPMHVRRKVGIAVGSVGIVSVGLGVGVGVAALGVRSDLQKACPEPKSCPRSQQSNLDRYNLLGNTSTALIIAGGVAAVAGVVLFATAPKAQRENKAFVAPVIGVGYAGAQGRF